MLLTWRHFVRTRRAGNEHFLAALGSEDFLDGLASEEILAASAEPSFQRALGDHTFVKMMGTAEFLSALRNTNFVAALGTRDFLVAVHSRHFLQCVMEREFTNDYESSGTKVLSSKIAEKMGHVETSVRVLKMQHNRSLLPEGGKERAAMPLHRLDFQGLLECEVTIRRGGWFEESSDISQRGEEAFERLRHSDDAEYWLKIWREWYQRKHEDEGPPAADVGEDVDTGDPPLTPITPSMRQNDALANTDLPKFSLHTLVDIMHYLNPDKCESSDILQKSASAGSMWGASVKHVSYHMEATFCAEATCMQQFSVLLGAEDPDLMMLLAGILFLSQSQVLSSGALEDLEAITQELRDIRQQSEDIISSRPQIQILKEMDGVIDSLIELEHRTEKLFYVALRSSTGFNKLHTMVHEYVASGMGRLMERAYKRGIMLLPLYLSFTEMREAQLKDMEGLASEGVFRAGWTHNFAKEVTYRTKRYERRGMVPLRKLFQKYLQEFRRIFNAYAGLDLGAIGEILKQSSYRTESEVAYLSPQGFVQALVRLCAAGQVPGIQQQFSKEMKPTLAQKVEFLLNNSLTPLAKTDESEQLRASIAAPPMQSVFSKFDSEIQLLYSHFAKPGPASGPRARPTISLDAFQGMLSATENIDHRISKDIPTRHVLQDIPTRHVLQDIPTRHALQDISTWHVLQDISTWHALQDIITWHALQEIPTWHALQDIFTWHALQDIPTRHALQDIFTWHALQDIPTWHALQDIFTWH
eukprot:gene7666-9130_t